ncbi:MAG: non-heme iron oxygenase ferredoxin subunit [Candidatus Eremiobacterota bacterium]
MAIHSLGKPTDFPEGELRAVEVDDEALVVCQVGGRFFCFEDRCTHDDGPLSGGWLDGCEVECPRHGARFDVRTGRALCMPAVAPMATFPVLVQGDELKVEL